MKLMPNHREHEGFNLSVLFVSLFGFAIVIAMTGLLFIVHYLVFFGTFLFSTFFMSPDLDTDSKVSHRWNKLSVIWFLYRKCSKHRGMSHKHVLGTLTKIAYLFAVFSAFWVVYLSIPDLPSASEFVLHDWEYLSVGLFAIMLADSCHIYKDWALTREMRRCKNA